MAIIFNIDLVILGSKAPIRIHDTLDASFPWMRVQAENILTCGPVSQLPQALCGVTSLNRAQLPSLQVFSAMVFDVAAMYVFWSLLTVFVAFVGMFLFLRDDLACGKSASAAGALMFAGIPAWLPGQLTVVGIPLVLWSMQRLFEPEVERRVRLGALAGMFCYFMGTSFILIFFAIIPLQLAFWRWGTHVRRSSSDWVRIALLWGVYVLLNGPLIAELLVHGPVSQRAALSAALPAGGSLSAAIAAFMQGLLKPTSSGWSLLTPTGLGVALVPVAYRVRRSLGRSGVFLVWAWVITNVFLFAVQTPWLVAMRTHLGPLSALQLNRASFLLTFLTPALVATVASRASSMGWLAGFRLTALGFALACAIALSQDWGRFHYLWWLGPPAVLAASTLIARRRRAPVVAAMLAAASLFAVLATVDYNRHYNVLPMGAIEDSPAGAYVKEREQAGPLEYRVLAYGARGGRYDPGLLMREGFSTAGGYSALYSQDFKDVWSVAIAPELGESQQRRDYFMNWGSRAYAFDSTEPSSTVSEFRCNPEVLKLLGVRYVFSRNELAGKAAENLVRLRVPDKLESSNALGTHWYLYEFVNQDSGLAFCSADVQVVDSRDDLLAALGRQTVDELRSAPLVESSSAAAFLPADLTDGRVLDFGLEPDRIEATVRSAGGTLLSVIYNGSPGWTCRIDGEEANITPVYGSFIGVYVPAGTHEVVFTYRNWWLGASWLALLIGGGSVVFCEAKTCAGRGSGEFFRAF